ncbi:hypothetical protein PR048_020376 [Dryococelus australis]|uniref:Uncharacterized protein n=1 Tax=Dryococelus australis TaxID=614101 RepID=A0ABQ9H639_9NEOP|nr:hypothetical protein PR048_020376 [Dryococelus australis]
MHHTPQIQDSGKPEIIEFYNSTNGGGLLLNPPTNAAIANSHFLNAIIDFAGVNSYVLFTTNLCNGKVQRRDFAISSGKPQINNHISRRLSEARLPRTLRMLTENVIRQPAQAAVEEKAMLPVYLY